MCKHRNLNFIPRSLEPFVPLKITFYLFCLSVNRRLRYFRRSFRRRLTRDPTEGPMKESDKAKFTDERDKKAQSTQKCVKRCAELAQLLCTFEPSSLP